MKYKYNSYPLGKVPKELQRPELDKLKELGYLWDDPRDVIDMFEKKVAEFAGAKYGVLVDCCSHGIFLSLKYLQQKGELIEWYDPTKTSWYYAPITIPKRTYVSVPMQIKHAGIKVDYEDVEWSGIYQIKRTRVYDGAVRWTKGMYVGNNALQVVSFQIKKRIPIGKGGIILTDDAEAAKMLKLMSYDGRDLTVPYDHPEHVKCLGYHMYMTPEDAARGIMLMDSVPEVNEDSGNYTMYPDVEIMMKNIK
jgi:dTDP-4-amino-4,6-dideoxygalactose transaminase